MEPLHLARLATHAVHLALELLRTGDEDGFARLRDAAGDLVPEHTATHHLVEVLGDLGAPLFHDQIAAGVRALNDPKRGIPDHPFALDSFARFAPVTDAATGTFRAHVASKQLQDGSIPVFCGYLPGGDFFSTLWSTRVLARYSCDVFGTEISLALRYLRDRRSVGATRISQLGFLGLLIAELDPTDAATISEIQAASVSALNGTAPDPNRLNLLDRLFLVEDLLAMSRVVPSASADACVDAQITSLFDLAVEPTCLPGPFAAAQKDSAPSLAFETLARGIAVAERRCSAAGNQEIGIRVNGLLHQDFRRVRAVAAAQAMQLARLAGLYGGIEAAFAPYEETLRRATDASPAERTVFLMMPFASDYNHRTLTEVIRRECAARGFKAIRVDDKDRLLAPRLWDNLVINMLSCSCAIAIHVTKPVMDAVKDGEKRLFPNPNVALEYGFFASRGREVLHLKDVSSRLPTDLEGFLWKEFDIANPDQSVSQHVSEWLDRRIAEEKARK